MNYEIQLQVYGNWIPFDGGVRDAVMMRAIALRNIDGDVVYDISEC